MTLLDVAALKWLFSNKNQSVNITPNGKKRKKQKHVIKN